VAKVTDKQQEDEYADADEVFFLNEEWDDRNSVDRSEGDSSGSSSVYE